MLIVCCFFFASSSPSLFLRYKSASNPFLRIGENGTYMGFARELLGRKKVILFYVPYGIH
jgi:hypothetical protein